MRIVTVCKKCLLTSEYPGIEFDSRGVCQLCRSSDRGFRSSPPSELVERCRQDFDETVRRIKGTHPYDGLICLSGGKDSVYLASVLKEKFGLRLLAYNVQTGFGSALSRSNLTQAVAKLELPLDQFVWPPDFSSAFFRYFFTNPLKQGLTATVCRVCQLALLGSAVRLAQEKAIPLVLIGYSPSQVARDWYYELKRETFLDTYRAFGGFWESPGISPSIKERYYFPTEGDDSSFPRILMPLHILDYPSEQEVRNRLQERGILEKRHTLTRRGMCDLRLLMAHCDTLHFGDTPFRDWVSEKIRKGEASRLRYLLKFKIFNWLCRTRLFKPRLLRVTLQRLDLTEKQILDYLEDARESEDVFRDIYKIEPSRELLARTKKDTGSGMQDT